VKKKASIGYNQELKWEGGERGVIPAELEGGDKSTKDFFSRQITNYF